MLAWPSAGRLQDLELGARVSCEVWHSLWGVMSVHASLCCEHKFLVGPLCRSRYVDWYALSESERLAACPIAELTVSESLILSECLIKLLLSNPQSRVQYNLCIT